MKDRLYQPLSKESMTQVYLVDSTSGSKIMRVNSETPFNKYFRLKAVYQPFNTELEVIADFTIRVCGTEKVTSLGDKWEINLVGAKGIQKIDTRQWIASSNSDCPAQITVSDSETTPLVVTNGPIVLIDTDRVKGQYSFVISAKADGQNPYSLAVKAVVTNCGDEDIKVYSPVVPPYSIMEPKEQSIKLGSVEQILQSTRLDCPVNRFDIFKKSPTGQWLPFYGRELFFSGTFLMASGVINQDANYKIKVFTKGGKSAEFETKVTVCGLETISLTDS